MRTRPYLVRLVILRQCDALVNRPEVRYESKPTRCAILVEPWFLQDQDMSCEAGLAAANKVLPQHFLNPFLQLGLSLDRWVDAIQRIDSPEYIE